jgi:hypothetical protein
MPDLFTMHYVLLYTGMLMQARLSTNRSWPEGLPFCEWS